MCSRRLSIGVRTDDTKIRSVVVTRGQQALPALPICERYSDSLAIQTLITVIQTLPVKQQNSILNYIKPVLRNEVTVTEHFQLSTN
jgi:hypothetical protein